MAVQEKPKSARWSLAFGITCLVLGVSLILNGAKAIKTGEILPATVKTSAMTGEFAVFTGCLAAGFGAAFLYAYFRSARKQK
jgi:hypothetical protein